MDFIIHLLLSLPSFSHEVIIPKYSLCQRLQHPFPVISHTTPLLPTADCPAGCRSSVAPSPSLVWFMSSLLSVGQSLIFTSRMLTRLSFIDNVVMGWWRFCCSFFFFWWPNPGNKHSHCWRVFVPDLDYLWIEALFLLLFLPYYILTPYHRYHVKQMKI